MTNPCSCAMTQKIAIVCPIFMLNSSAEKVPQSIAIASFMLLTMRAEEHEALRRKLWHPRFARSLNFTVRSRLYRLRFDAVASEKETFSSVDSGSDLTPHQPGEGAEA